MILKIKPQPIKNFVLIFFVLSLATYACKKEGEIPPNEEDKLSLIEKTLDEFVGNLVANPPSTADLSGRVKAYIETKNPDFFGSTVTLLDSNGMAEFSPYWYRENGSFAMKDLADTAYHIDEQDWLRKPIDEKKAIWTDPYFDAGGGEIWMRTRSVPVVVDGKIIAVATTDLEVDEPK